MSFSLELQEAIFSKLSNDTDVTDLAEVFDDVAENQTFPYLTIGEDVLNEWDTNSTLGADSTITIHVWSRYKGRKQTKEIMGAIYNCLHRSTLTVTGYDFVSVNYDTETSFLDSDGLTRHGVQTYRVLIDKN